MEPVIIEDGVMNDALDNEFNENIFVDLDDERIEQADSWPILKTFFDSRSLVQQQLDSFNKFIFDYIKRILRHIKTEPLRDDNKRCWYYVSYGKYLLKKPVFTEMNRKKEIIYPDQCRDRDITYASPTFVDIHIKIEYDDGRIEEKVAPNIKIAEIPVMVKSKICHLHGCDEERLRELKEDPMDHGGYTILNGKEKGLIAQERLSYNQIFVFPKKQWLEVEIRCYNEDNDQQSTVNMRYKTNKKYGGCIRVVVPHVHEPKGVFLFALFYALGLTDNETIVRMIVYPFTHDSEMREHLQGSALEAEHLVGDTPQQTSSNALAYLSSYVKPRIPTNNAPIQKPKSKMEMLVEILDKELFPHLHPSDEFDKYESTDPKVTFEQRCKQKAWFLGYSINRLLRVQLERDESSDRDHMAHKRLNLSGPLLAQLFKKKMQKQHNDMMAHLRKLIQRNKDLNFNIAMKPKDVTRGLAYALKTGNWNTNRNQPSNSSKNQGVSQILNRLNYIAPLSHLRRTTASDTTLSVVRQQHNTQYGFICPSETPEGQSCLTLDTPILTDIGYMPIGNLKNGDRVITVNPDTYETSVTEIYDYFQKEALVKDIGILGGWNIKATDDHPFLSKDGWKEVKDLSIEDYVYLKYVQTEYSHFVENKNIVLEDLSSVRDMKESILEKHTKVLKESKILPLYNDDIILPILARMFGYVVSNGYITMDSRTGSVCIQLCFRQDKDAGQFQYDLESLKLDGIIHNTSCTSTLYSTIVYLFLALGLKNATFPDWVVNGSMLVKREFLAGFQNGNCKIKDHSLFKEFSINSSEEITKAINEEDFEKIINFSDDFVKYMKCIGYRYAYAKQENLLKIYFYLLYATSARSLRTLGASNGACSVSASSTHTSCIPFTKFVDENYNEMGCFMPIYSIKTLGLRTVADFTTRSQNHSFISNDIVTHNCGIVKNLAMLSHISKGTDAYNVYKWLKDNVNYIPITKLNPNKSVFGWKIFVNGNFLGIFPSSDKSEMSFDKKGNPMPIPGWVRDFKTARSLGKIDEDVSISTHTNIRKEICIFTDEGRFCRPLFIVDSDTGELMIKKRDVDNLHINFEKITVNDEHVLDDAIKWDDLVTGGLRVIEYLDAAEVESTRIAFNVQDIHEQADLRKNVLMSQALRNSDTRMQEQLASYIHYTHCEIHPSMMLGITASNIPFPDHNQSPRNTYESAMMKQAIGIPTLTYPTRMDTTNYVLQTPQRPLVYTKPTRLLKLDEMPVGVNAVLAIMEYTGYNQEDSVIVNQGALDRGFMRIDLYKTYKTEAKKNKILADEVFEMPDPDECMGMKKACYDKIGKDGLVKEGTWVDDNDIIVGKTGPSSTFSSFARTRSYNKTGTVRVPTNMNPKHIKKDHSLSTKSEGYVDKVYKSVNSDGNEFVKVRVRSQRIPEIGDKVAAMSGQKGTIGMILPQSDMPFSERGMIPDIIMNPHAMPSRMTIGQLMELLLGKVSALNGEHGDATPFEPVDIGDFCAELTKHGFESRGWETLYNGYTGEKLKAHIFMCPTYYQRLKHMAREKIHSRSRGPVTVLTRQPVEGRAREGGLRYGEMERDCTISAGLAQFLRERMFKLSDDYKVPVCKECGMIAESDSRKQVNYCRLCDSYDHVELMEIPYASKLLFQELMSMLIQPRFKLE